MTTLFDSHRDLLDRAVEAVRVREFWTPFREIPSGKFYGDSAKADGEAADAVLRAADEPGAQITGDPVGRPDIGLIDYTGSSASGDWIRQNAGTALVFREETGVNSVTVTGTDDFSGMCANLAFSLSPCSGQMCTAPQNLYIPRGGIETDKGHKSFDDAVEGIASAINVLLGDPDGTASVCGAIADLATVDRVGGLRGAGRIIRGTGETGRGCSATPLLMAVDEVDDGPQRDECFGPVSFAIPCEDARAAIAAASEIA